MSETIPFAAFDDLPDWRVLFDGAFAHYRTGSFATGVEFVDRIGALASAADHYPDLDLRPDGATVRLSMLAARGLRQRDHDLAQQISAVARELELTADPSAVQVIQFAIDRLVPADVQPFWRAVLGYAEWGEEDVVDPHRRGPSIWFQDLDAPRPQRNRIHVDVCVPADIAQSRVDAAMAAGGRMVNDANAPQWWTLADAEGNEVDVATMYGRG